MLLLLLQLASCATNSRIKQIGFSLQSQTNVTYRHSSYQQALLANVPLFLFCLYEHVWVCSKLFLSGGHYWRAADSSSTSTGWMFCYMDVLRRGLCTIQVDSYFHKRTNLCQVYSCQVKKKRKTHSYKKSPWPIVTSPWPIVTSTTSPVNGILLLCLLCIEALHISQNWLFYLASNIAVL